MAKSTRTVIGAGLVGAILGAVVTWIVLPRATTTVVQESALAQPEAERTPPIAPPDSPQLVGAAPKSGGGGARDSLSALIAAVTAGEPKPPTGTGTITGHVMTKDGAPLEGAVIRASTFLPSPPPARSGSIPPMPRVEGTVRDSVLRIQWEDATHRDARADASGAFTLTDLLDAPYYVSAWAVGYEVRARRGSNARDARPGAIVEFEASPVVEVPVTVLSPDGAPAAIATVRWSPPKGGGGGGTAWTKANPLVPMELGTWNVTAEVGDEMRSQPVLVTAAVGTEAVTLRLEVRNRIQGTVRLDEADKDWAYVYVSLRSRGGAATKSVGVQAPGWTFYFTDLAAGDYDVTAGITDWAPVVTEPVHVEGGKVVVALTIPRLTVANFLEARVFGPDGRLLEEEDVSFAIMEKREKSSTAQGARIVRRADGTFLIALASPSAVRRERVREGAGGGRGGSTVAPPEEGPIQCFLQVQSKANGKKEVEFAFGTTPRVEVRFP